MRARHAAAAAPRLPQPLDRPGDLDARRRDRRRSPCRTRSTSSPARRRSSACSGSPRSSRCSSCRSSAARSPTRTTAARCSCAPRPGWRSSPGSSSLNALLPHPQVWALFVLQCDRRRRLQPRPAGDELARAAARAGRGDRRGRVALDSVYSSLGARRRARRSAACSSRSSGVPWTYGIDCATYAASLVAIWALPKLPPLEEVDRPSLQSIVDGFRFLKGRQALIGIFAGRHERDGLRHAERALPGDRAAPARRRRVDRRLPLRGAVRGRARRLALLRLDVARRAGRGSPSRSRRALWGAAIAGFGFMTTLWPALVLLAVAGGADFYSAVLRSTILLAVDARPPARAPARDRVHAGRERAEPRRPRGGRARLAHVAPLLGRLRRLPLHRRLHRRRRSRCPSSSATTPGAVNLRRSPHEVAPELIGAELLRRRRRRRDRRGRGLRPRGSRRRTASATAAPSATRRCSCPAATLRLPLVRDPLVPELRLRRARASPARC